MTQALTHRSRGRHNNERLEFLGDSFLNCVVSARLFELKPDGDEGELSRLRARVVRGETLARLAADLKLGDYIHMGEGELKSGGYKRKSILADTLEAIIGAIYLDGGYESCAAAVLHICDPVIAVLPDASELVDPKTRLQEWLQGHGYPLPEYRLLNEKGQPHNKEFEMQCFSAAAGIEVSGTGSSRQKAEQASAIVALDEIAGNPDIKR